MSLSPRSTALTMAGSESSGTDEHDQQADVIRGSHPRETSDGKVAQASKAALEHHREEEHESRREAQDVEGEWAGGFVQGLGDVVAWHTQRRARDVEEDHRQHCDASDPVHAGNEQGAETVSGVLADPEFKSPILARATCCAVGR